MRKLIVASATVLLCGTVASAQSFVYANNDVAGLNSFSAFSISSGVLTQLPGSPYLTGGTGLGLTLYAINRVTSVRVDDFLYVANGGSNDISSYWIDPLSGVPSTLNDPIPVPGTSFQGISLAATPNQKYLIAVNSGISASQVTVFLIYLQGYLIRVNSFSVPDQLDGIKITANGKFLSAAAVVTGKVYMWALTPFGGLNHVPGSPFAATLAAGVETNCAGNHLYAGEANGVGTNIEAFNIASNGALTPIGGSPFTGPSNNSNVVLLSPDQTHLFVSNQNSNTITVFNVAGNGVLSSPAVYPAPGATTPVGMATDQAGAYLFVADTNNVISSFSIDPGTAALTPVAGQPFATGVAGALHSLTVFPPSVCH